jgi:hypothetical protein
MNINDDKNYSNLEEEHVIENVFEEYYCPPEKSTEKIKKGWKHFKHVAGTKLAKGIYHSSKALYYGATHIKEGFSYSLNLAKSCLPFIKLLARPLLVVSVLAGMAFAGIWLFDMMGSYLTEFFKAQPTPIAIHPTSIDVMVKNTQNNLSAMSDIISSVSYLIGVMFGIKASLAFKEHAEDPDRIPLSKPIVYMMLAAMLVALPEFLRVGVNTIY